MDGTEIMGKRVEVSKSTNVSKLLSFPITFYYFLTYFFLRMVPEIMVAEEVVVDHAVEVRRDVVVANDHTEHHTLLLLKIFPVVASKFLTICTHLTQSLVHFFVQLVTAKRHHETSW